MYPTSSDHWFFRNYTFYRIFICLILIMMFFAELEPRLVGAKLPNHFITGVIIYGAICLLNLSIVNAPIKTSHVRKALLLSFFVDIVMIGFLSYTSGVSGNPLLLLLIVIVAISAISMGSATSILLAATASIVVLLRNGLLFTELGNSDLLLSAALQGVIFFLTGIVVHRLSHRLTLSENLANSQATTMAGLEHFNKLIVQRLQTGVIVATNNHQIRFINASAQRLLGDPSPSKGWTTDQVLPKVIADKLDDWLAHKHSNNDSVKTYNSGPKIKLSFAKLTNDNSVDSLIFLEDDRLIQQQAQNIKLSALARLTASIAHEIRNPLGSISHAAQLLLESENLDKMDAKLAQIIQSNCLRMNQIIENVLSLSSRGKAKPKLIDLSVFLQHFKDDFCYSQPDSILDIDIQTPGIAINFDHSQLTQVVSNLCINAIRYSEQKTAQQRVLLRAYTDQNNGLPQLDIIDFGPGVSDDNIYRIFEPFFTTEKTGSGLGLYLCREMCETNHTSLNYKAKPHSCFKLTFSHPLKNWSTK